MSLKRLLLIFVLAMLPQIDAEASVRGQKPFFKSGRIQLGNLPEGGDTIVIRPPPPVRQANLKMEIGKGTFIKVGTDYRFERSVVCSRRISVDVYDLRNLKDGSAMPNEIECESTFDGQPVTVLAGGTMVLRREAPFSDESETDLKSYASYLQILRKDLSQGPGGPELQEFVSQNVFSRDLNQKAFGGDLRPMVILMCYDIKSALSRSSIGVRPSIDKPISQHRLFASAPAQNSNEPVNCTPNFSEYFFATFEVED